MVPFQSLPLAIPCTARKASHDATAAHDPFPVLAAHLGDGATDVFQVQGPDGPEEGVDLLGVERRRGDGTAVTGSGKKAFEHLCLRGGSLSFLTEIE